MKKRVEIYNDGDNSYYFDFHENCLVQRSIETNKYRMASNDMISKYSIYSVGDQLTYDSFQSLVFFNRQFYFK